VACTASVCSNAPATSSCSTCMQTNCPAAYTSCQGDLPQ
jgi:hypothetical protein